MQLGSQEWFKIAAWGKSPPATTFCSSLRIPKLFTAKRRRREVAKSLAASSIATSSVDADPSSEVQKHWDFSLLLMKRVSYKTDTSTLTDPARSEATRQPYSSLRSSFSFSRLASYVLRGEEED